MFVIADSVDEIDRVIGHIWETSKSVKGLPKDFILLDADECILEPGGWQSAKIPFADFIIDGVQFKVQLSSVEEVVRRMKAGTERVPGYMRVTMCKPATRWPMFIILPIGVYRALIEKLEQLMRTDGAIHANLNHNQGLDNIRAWELEQIKNPPKI